jgi:hypothetical protein
MKKFTSYIKENIDSDYSELAKDVKSLIENTIETFGGDFDSFVESFLQNPEDVKIEGLINDSDIYEFYLKWKNEIDEILNDVNFFDQSPTDLNVFGVYEYLIVSTMSGVEEVIKNF